MAPHLSPELAAALAGAMTPKFLATVGPGGEPNIVPVISIQPWDEQTVVFGEYLMQKSRRNLERCAEVGILVITEALEAWSLRGTFLGFHETGEYVERVNRSELLRYNAYTSIRAAGVIRVEEASGKTVFTKGGVLGGYLRGRLLRPLLTRRAGGRRVMPLAVAEKFSRLQAVRAGAYVAADGYPRAFPMLSCFPAGPDRLLLADREVRPIARALAPGTRLAVAVLTFEPIAYQVKGAFRGTRGGVGVVDLDDCFSASPPLVGERLTRAGAQ